MTTHSHANHLTSLNRYIMVRARVWIIPDSVFYRRDVNLSLVIPCLRRRDAPWYKLDNRIKPADERSSRDAAASSTGRDSRSREGAVYTRFIHLNGQIFRDVLLSYARTHAREPSAGPFSQTLEEEISKW